MHNKPLQILHIDCASGISGDMLLAALIDAGADFDSWLAGISKLALDPFPEIVFEDASTSGVIAKRLRIIEKDPSSPMRKPADMERILEKSGLPDQVKEKTAAALRRLAACEAEIHGKTIDEVHFHELSGADTLIDVAGAFLALDMLGVDEITCSPVNVGSGTVECEHGVFPVPAPATAKLLEGAAVFGHGEGERTTPTGALLATEIAACFADMPEMRLLKAGAGTGTRDYGAPCVLRTFLGEKRESAFCHPGKEAGAGRPVLVVSANLDDMEPRIAGYVMDRLLAAGALDVFIEPVYMKKNRPAFILNALCDHGRLDRVTDIFMRETTTLGVRIQRVERVCMERRIETIGTPDGPARVKIGTWKGKILRVNPEYDDCARLAEKSGRPLADIIEEIKIEADKKFRG